MVFASNTIISKLQINIFIFLKFWFTPRLHSIVHASVKEDSIKFFSQNSLVYIYFRTVQITPRNNLVHIFTLHQSTNDLEISDLQRRHAR